MQPGLSKGTCSPSPLFSPAASTFFLNFKTAFSPLKFVDELQLPLDVHLEPRRQSLAYYAGRISDMVRFATVELVRQHTTYIARPNQ